MRKEICHGFQCCGAGWNADLGLAMAPVIGLASAHLLWQILTVDLESRADCMAKFVSNQYYGALIFSGIVFGKLLS